MLFDYILEEGSYRKYLGLT